MDIVNYALNKNGGSSSGGASSAQVNKNTTDIESIREELDIAASSIPAEEGSEEGYDSLSGLLEGEHQKYTDFKDKIEKTVSKNTQLSKLNEGRIDTLFADRPTVLETWAEYEALSEEEKASGTYYIKEDKKVDVQVIENYSADEQVVGVFEGKPLYRKIVEFGSLTNKTEKKIDHNISNLENFKRFEIYAFNNNGTFCCNIPYVSPGGYDINCSISNTSISIQPESDRSSLEAYAILEYTKTTDETSLSTNPAFLIKETVPMQQKYSTDEQVVGEWIDGKPLYQKTIVYNNKVNSGATQISHGIDNVDEIIKNEVVAKSNTGTVPIPSISTNSVWTILVSGINETVIEFNSGSEIANYLNKFYITLQYTKITDTATKEV